MQEEAVFNTWNKTRHTKNLKHEQQPEWSRTIHKNFKDILYVHIRLYASRTL